MTRAEAKRLVGDRVMWTGMHEDIAPSTTILERIGAQGRAVVTYRIKHEIDRLWLNKRYTTIVKVRDLQAYPY